MEIVEEENTSHHDIVENFTVNKNPSKKIFTTETQENKMLKVRNCLNEIKEEEAYSDDSQYSVEDIVDKRVFKGRVKYLVKWRGYEEPTWEKEENMNCELLIREFENRKKIQKNDKKVKTEKQRGHRANKISKLKVELSKRRIRRGSFVHRNVNQTERQLDSSKATATVPCPVENPVSIKGNDKSLKCTNVEGTVSKHRDNSDTGRNFKRRSLTPKINSWVRNEAFQKANASEGAIDVSTTFCGSCGSPLSSKQLPDDGKKKRSSSSSGCSKSKHESDMSVVRYKRSPLRLSASTSPLFGSPLDLARTSKKLRNAERIVGARLVGEEIMFLVKWEGSDLPDWIPSRIGSMQFPQLVIKYYEDRLMWNTSSAESTPR